VRAHCEIETDGDGREAIIVSEIPYQVNKAKLIERIAELAREKVVEGITDLRDESDRQGMRIVIDAANGAGYRVAPVALYELGAEVIKRHQQVRGKGVGLALDLGHALVPVRHVPIGALDAAGMGMSVEQIVAQFMC
jgi:hypothetical protein